MAKQKILIVEDEEKLARILSLVLQDNGYKVRTASDGKQGIFQWTKWHPDLVLTDLKMKPVDGMAVLKFGRLNFPDIPLVILTAFGSIETAVNAMKKGAFDFLTKPLAHEQLLEVVEQALCIAPSENSSLTQLIGNSPAMDKIRRDIHLFASTDSSVLIQGASGTGKELAARAIHDASKRQSGSFVKVNCAAIPKDLIESELFGHQKGAFTGAIQDRQGAFVRADKGTLFLDEIGDLPLALQAKLLHAVEEKTITPVGAGTEIPVSVKILSATNQDLETMIVKNQFRSDLYYRLNTVCLNMPALRDKKSDITDLASFFLEKFCREFNRPLRCLSNDAIQCLEAYAWPGNVRELKNVMERAALTCNSIKVCAAHLPGHISDPPAGARNDQQAAPADFDIVAQEQSLMLAALEQCGWNQSKAAKKLGITRGALRYRLQKYGIRKDQ
ncbi:sigma-54-dependent transcriptional regulator [Desulfospira joergensenii]|uniref:sigma-54-dependent transcriptional regulator n=1 Tax=Desulfospira joergensenii TaxID=53329 RepID=UPI0003B4D14A|nr:sigma-54 dependent transcriptional regulator [Desulfospira joergensenii]